MVGVPGSNPGIPMFKFIMSDNLSSLKEKGLKALQSKKFQKALTYLERALELDPEDVETHYYLGVTYTNLEEWEPAIEHLLKVLRSPLTFVHNRHVLLLLGYIYIRKEDFLTALGYLERVLEKEPENSQALGQAAYCHYCMGDLKKAAELYRKLCQVEPEDYNAHNGLAYVLAELEEDLDTALEEAQKAWKLAPERASVLDTLGWVHFKRGEIEEAYNYLRKAFEKNPDEPVIREHLKQVLEKR